MKKAVFIFLFFLLNCSVEVIDPTDETPSYAVSAGFNGHEKSSAHFARKIEPEIIEVPSHIETWDKGGYPKGGPWVTIGYQDRDDFSNVITASRIALAAKILIDTWEEWNYPNVEEVKEKLSNFHVIAVKDTDEMARLRYPELYSESPELAIEEVGDLGAWCNPHGNPAFIDVPEKATFFIVIKASFLSNGWMDTVLHEMGHAALLVGFGDTDSNHERIDFWLPRTGLDNGSFLASVLSKYP